MIPPPLRGLETRPVPRAGGFAVELTCPWGLLEPGTSLDATGWMVARRFDGRSSASEIAAAVSAELGTAMASAEVEGLAERLERLGLCDGPSFRARRELAAAEFQKLPLRAFDPQGCGASDDPLEWRIQVAGLVANDWDMPAVPRLAAAWTPAVEPSRASHLYSRTYAALRHVEPCARILALGWTAAELSAPIAVCRRGFATPLGVQQDDAAAAELLEGPSPIDELAHAGSTSLARQASFLRLVQPRTPWVAVLASLPRGRGTASPQGVDAVERVIDRMSALLLLPGSTWILCASDLSRGPRPPALQEARRIEAEAVDAALRLEPEEFWSHAALRDPACAFAPYLMLRLLARVHPGVRGSTLGYRQMARGPELVTAASVVFHEDAE